MYKIICSDCKGLIGRNRECTACVESGRKVAWASEFTSGTGKSMLGFKMMQAWKKSGGEVVFISLEATPNYEGML